MVGSCFGHRNRSLEARHETGVKDLCSQVDPPIQLPTEVAPTKINKTDCEVLGVFAGTG